MPISQHDSQDDYEDVHIYLPDEDETHLFQTENECVGIYEPIYVRKFIVPHILSFLICWFVVLVQAESFAIFYNCPLLEDKKPKGSRATIDTFPTAK